MDIATGVCKYSSLTEDAIKSLFEKSIESTDFWPPNTVRLIGYKQEEQRYYPDDNADFCAIVFPELKTIHIVLSKYVCRCKRCAPCHPIHGAVDYAENKAGDEVLAYTFLADFFVNPIKTITVTEKE